MASEATTYFYTLLALGAIGLMITSSFEANAMDLRTASGKRGLKELLEAIASEGAELIALAEATGASSRVCLHLPGTLGNIRWWARLASDSTGAWVEGSLGDPWEGGPELRVELPWNVSASGTYEGGVGIPSLSCSRQGSNIVLTLGKWETG